MTLAVFLGAMAVYLAVGARFARRCYVEGHRRWFDEKIRERRKLLAKRRKTEEPQETLALVRKQWEQAPKGQGEVLGFALFVALVWPVAALILRLVRDPVPTGEEATLVNAALEAEVERLRRQVEG